MRGAWGGSIVTVMLVIARPTPPAQGRARSRCGPGRKGRHTDRTRGWPEARPSVVVLSVGHPATARRTPERPIRACRSFLPRLLAAAARRPYPYQLMVFD